MKINLAGYNVDRDMLGTQDCFELVTPETISAAYARISRSPKPVDELRKEAVLDVAQARKSNQTIIFEFGHASVAEHAVFNFDIMDVSRLAIESIEHSRLCVTGDSVLVSASHPAPRQITIQKLYEAWNDKKRNAVRRRFLRSVDDAGRVVPRGVADVVKVGVRPVYTVTTRCGRSLTATVDELFLTPDRGYVELQTLRVGDRVAANGLPAYRNREWLEYHYLKKNKERVEVAKLAGVSDACIGLWVRRFGLQKPKTQYPGRRGGGGKVGMHTPEGRARIAAARSGTNNESWKGDEATLGAGHRRAHRMYPLTSCECCNGTKGMSRHHVDGNPLNNVLDNVVMLCSSCHRAHHGGRSALTVFSTPITSITYAGEQNVYCLKMHGTEKNVVVNGIVIHNCSFTEKSQRYLKLNGDMNEVYTPAEMSEAFLPFDKLMKSQLGAYQDLLVRLKAHAEKHGRPQGGNPEEDARYVTGLAVTGQLGMTINARNLETMVRRLLSHPLEEVQQIGCELFHRAAEVAPSLLRYCEPERIRQLQDASLPALFTLSSFTDAVVALGHSRDADDTVLTALLFQRGQAPFEICQAVVEKMSVADKWQTFCTLYERMELHSAAPRCFELPGMVFELVGSASFFAQLKRHRMATILPQSYDLSLGVTVPQSVEDAGAMDVFNHIRGLTEKTYREYQQKCGSMAVAEYCLMQAHRRRVLVKMNARELYAFSRLREDGHAQWEIRDVAKKLIATAREVMPMTLALACGKDEFVACKKYVLDTSWDEQLYGPCEEKVDEGCNDVES